MLDFILERVGCRSSKERCWGGGSVQELTVEGHL